jgi:hypothetical protein
MCRAARKSCRNLQNAACKMHGGSRSSAPLGPAAWPRESHANWLPFTTYVDASGCFNRCGTGIAGLTRPFQLLTKENAVEVVAFLVIFVALIAATCGYLHLQNRL